MSTGWSGRPNTGATSALGLPTGWVPTSPTPATPVDDPDGWVPAPSPDVVPPSIIRGPRGLPGEPGGKLYKKAKRAISGTRVVRLVDDGEWADIADPFRIDDVDLVTGISLTAASSMGQALDVMILGEMEDSSWTLTPFKRVFLGANGRLVQVIDPNWAFVCVVGTALTATKILVNVRPAVILNP